MTRDEALRILGLSADAPAAEVLTAYRELAQMLHPDKFGGNGRLQDRAERQMRGINEARDVLLGKGASAAADAPASATSIAFEAEARAHAAETARLVVVAQARAMRERRSPARTMLGVGIVGMFICSRFRGTVGSFGFAIATTLATWGVVDLITMSRRIGVLDGRARELRRTRDRARDIARRAQEL